MKVHQLEKENSLLNVFISEIRDVSIQKDSLRFRKNIERIGEILAFEISKKISYKFKKINTPFGEKDVAFIEENIVICSILRAGLPMHQGVLNFFDRAESAFVSAYRKTNKSGNIEVITNYAATPSLDGKILILVDPMIATGTTILDVLNVLSDFGKPKEIYIAAAIGSLKGVEHLSKNLPENLSLYIASIDDVLNSHYYIIPGLGDAGDLAFGKKL